MNYSKWEILLACCKSEYEIVNSKRGSKSSTGFRGVSMYGKRWKSVIYVNNKQIYLGSFGSPEEAYLAYQKSRINKILNK